MRGNVYTVDNKIFNLNSSPQTSIHTALRTDVTKEAMSRGQTVGRYARKCEK